MKPIIWILLAAALLAPLSLITAEASEEARPNFIIIFADDLGYGDLGCYGHPSIRTPHLDRMAREGMRFTDFYSAAEVCTPSRTALLTGRYPVRSGMCHDRFRVLRRVSTGCLPAEEITLAEALKTQGYATACVGKWHLGQWENNPAGHPSRHGFDTFFGLPHSNDMNPGPALPKGAPARLDQDPAWWEAPLYRNEKLIEQAADQTTLTRRYTEEAVNFIREHKDKPFFLYLPHTFPHVPLFASESFRGKSSRGLYGDVVEELDASVGQVLETLRSEGLDKNTLVFFTSDNGPWLTQGLAGGSAGLLREGKGSTWEGGMRVPGIAWRPGFVPAGSTCHEIASTMDLFTTCLSLAGAKVPADRPVDGYDIRPLLTGTGNIERDTYFYYRGTKLFAARQGKWKAHFWTQPAYGTPEPEAHDPPLLFDLQVDPGESINVAAQHPEVIRQITAAVERHRAELKPAPSQLEAAVAMPIAAPAKSDTAQAASSPESLPQPKSRSVRTLEGWKIRIDDRLLQPPHEQLGARSLRFLENKLSDIQAILPAERVAELRTITIVLDLNCGKLGAMQYHPSAGWLTDNGYPADLEKCVHLPRAEQLPTRRNITEQPWVILHELAHAYHDQVLGFDDPRVKDAYENFKKSGHGDATLLYNGKRVKHYGLTNHKEFFAEMTESYFGLNDFFPFNGAELQEAEPETFALLTRIWKAPPKASP